MLRFILPSILWTTVVIFLSLTPRDSFDDSGFYFEGIDKIIHSIMYFFLTLLWSIGLKRQNISKSLWNNAFIISVFGGFTLSFILEVLQEYFTTTRSFELLDLLANGIGCIFGLLMFLVIYPNYKR